MELGRQCGLKIRSEYSRAGSMPVWATTKENNYETKMQTIMTVATAGPVAHPLRVKLNWSSSGLLIRGVRVQLASPALCAYGVVVTSLPSKQLSPVRPWIGALTYRHVA